FEVLPRFILGLPYGNYWGFVFFVCLYLSAFNASLGLFEAIVSGGMSILSERASRTVTTAVLGGVVFLLSLLPFISAVVSPFGISGLPAAIEVMDRILVNWFLPLLGALLGLALFRGTDEETRSSLFLRKDNRESFALYPYWRALVGLVIPFLVVFALVFEVIGLVVT
ncbi:MAG: hypothetical protein N2578_01695, partial [Bdellovibrionaceae bacterium]|nr:hypothetical protein [Pseudobdellovibrionaceae bacterium]